MHFYWEKKYRDMVIGANMTNYIKNLRNMNKELMAIVVNIVITTTMTYLNVSMIFQVISVLTVLRNGLRMKKND